MKKAVNSSIKIGVSCVLFDSPKFEKILLIHREREPVKWSFPGGRLEKGESIKFGIERETYEETGYRITLAPNSLYNVIENEELKYIVISGLGFINDVQPSEIDRTQDDINIKQKFYSIDKNGPDSLHDLKDDDCIPELKAITQRFIDTYKGKY